MGDEWFGIGIVLFIGFIIGIFVGIMTNNDDIENFTLIENESNDWYWLENKEYTETTLNEFFALKRILINNECTDGGFIETTDGNRFLIVCYEAKKVIKEVKENEN